MKLVLEIDVIPPNPTSKEEGGRYYLASATPGTKGFWATARSAAMAQALVLDQISNELKAKAVPEYG